jgi:phage terminase Nu1 subunit (DNA packaging protein)
VPNETPNPTVPVGTLAKLFNLTDIRVQQLAKMGVCVKAERGRYDLWASVKGYIKYLQERAVGRGPEGGGGEGDDYQKHRARLYKARADKEEIQASLLAGKAHDAAIIEKVWGDMLANAKTRIMAIPTKAAGRVQSVLPLPQVEALLREPCMEALNELAVYDPRRLVEEFVATHRDELEEDGEAARRPAAEEEADTSAE